MELFKANKQWSNRPADERFRSLQDIYNVTRGYAESAREVKRSMGDITTAVVKGDVQLIGSRGNAAGLTNWSFGQLARLVDAPADYLRTLPAELASTNLAHGLRGLAKDKIAQLLFHAAGSDSFLLRAITSDRYARIWNWEVAERMLALESQGWEPARPDIRILDDFPALYASDHDMFVFLRNSAITVKEAESTGAVYRGVIVENSEVGASALKLTRFLYREMCGNHIIWGASDVVDISIRHVGDAKRAWQAFAVRVREWANESSSDEEAKISRARHAVIAATKDEVLDAIFGKRNIGLSRKALAAGYDAVNIAQDGEPNTQWGLVQGLTRYSQTLPYADQRTDLDRKAGKLLDLDF